MSLRNWLLDRLYACDAWIQKRQKESERMVELSKAVRAGEYVFTEKEVREIARVVRDKAHAASYWRGQYGEHRYKLTNRDVDSTVAHWLDAR